MTGSAAYDLVIRDGAIIDGAGAPSFLGDVAVSEGRIAAIGVVDGQGREEIDAAGRIVTPGFVDIHTHYDGQVTWSNRLSPSSAHGVTTVVIGNCGIGFAPCRPADREAMIQLMEGVEDIPGAVMAEGIPWEWESFPDYMDFLGSRQYDVNVAAYLPHAPLRVYAMGQRGLDREPATHADLQQMSELTAEAIRAGALGFSTSRSLNHRSSEHHLMPGVSAAEGELIELGKGINRGGLGVLQFIADFDSPESDFAMLRRIVEGTGLPMTFSLMQIGKAPDRWRTVLKLAEQANQDGLWMKPQVYPRPMGMIAGLRLNYNFFTFSPSFEAIKHLPHDQLLAAMRDPGTRSRIISEYPVINLEPTSPVLADLHHFFLMDDIPDYEPPEADSLAAIAAARGVSPAELAYDLLIDNNGDNVFYGPAVNFVEHNLDAAGEMLRHPDTLFGLGDGGAHVGIICDATAQTFMLQRWVGDGSNGTMPLEKVVHALTGRNAQALNLLDRGIIAPGYRADLNVIDLERLKLFRPEMAYDLPLGSGRLLQKVEGYDATIVAGEVTYRHGEFTGKLPGRLVRGAQSAPV